MKKINFALCLMLAVLGTAAYVDMMSVAGYPVNMYGMTAVVGLSGLAAGLFSKAMPGALAYETAVAIVPSAHAVFSYYLFHSVSFAVIPYALGWLAGGELVTMAAFGLKSALFRSRTKGA